MHPVDPEDVPALAHWFAPERPGPLIWAHIAQTGHGNCLVDRWPVPRTVLAHVGGNIALRGDPDRLDDQTRATLAGFVDAPAHFLPALREIDPGLHVWPRVISVRSDDVPLPAHRSTTAVVRRLGPDDAADLGRLAAGDAWIANTYDGPVGLAATGRAWGAFVGAELASVAVPFYRSAHYEDLGVVTAEAHRGRGLSTACAAGLVGDVQRAGRHASWTTSPDNAGSLGVARRLGFTLDHEDVSYLVRTPVP